MLLAVGIGGFFGAIARFSISGWIQNNSTSSLPLGTFVVNILGSFLIGFLFLYFQHINLSPTQKAMFIAGLLGSLTTFSTFSLETLLMLQEGFVGKALTNISINLFFSLSATALGMLVFKKIYGVSLS